MRIAVVLFNLGGPEKLDDVRPFLKNLFSDPAIISLPGFLRAPLANFIAAKREKEARHIYSAIGGGSPLRANTDEQAKALEEKLNAQAGGDQYRCQYRCFVSMRYWRPFSAEAAARVKAWNPDRIVFLPLYPHFSTTTTASSFRDFEAALATARAVATPSSEGGAERMAGNNARAVATPSSEGGAERMAENNDTRAAANEKQPEEKDNAGLTHYICCYPTLDGFIAAQAELIAPRYAQMLKECAEKNITQKPRILFSAHGLPEKVIAAGDPYQHQCELTAQAIVKALAIPGLDYKNTYQSRVGPLKWIGPYTDAEIMRAGAEGVPLLVVPIAFVSEHSETLYEIEQQYRELAAGKGVPLFARVPAVATHPAFIAGLARLVNDVLRPESSALMPDGGKRICPASCGKCPCLA